MNAAYFDFAVDLVVNTSAIFLLAYALYFRRHRRADLLLGYVALNMGIFVAMSLLTTVRLDIALGFGLFAILSIIRLRSTSVTQQEVAYYFVALVMGLVNGLAIENRPLIIGINVLLLATMFLVDSNRLRDRARRLDVTLDTVHGDDAALVADLEARLGGQVMYHQVNEVDYLRETMSVDVRYRAGTRPVEPRVGRAPHGGHPGRRAHRGRRAGRRPRAPPRRAGAAPAGQGHRLRPRHHGRRRAVPALGAPSRVPPRAADRRPAARQRPRRHPAASSRSPSARRSGADRPCTGRSGTVRPRNGQAANGQLRNGQVTGVRS